MQAKRRLALVEAGHAVAIALTPGMPVLERVSIQPRGNIMTRLVFRPTVCPGLSVGPLALFSFGASQL